LSEEAWKAGRNENIRLFSFGNRDMSRAAKKPKAGLRKCRDNSFVVLDRIGFTAFNDLLYVLAAMLERKTCVLKQVKDDTPKRTRSHVRARVNTGRLLIVA